MNFWHFTNAAVHRSPVLSSLYTAFLDRKVDVQMNCILGHGLPAGLAEVEMIERARAKRAW